MIQINAQMLVDFLQSDIIDVNFVTLDDFDVVEYILEVLNGGTE